MKSSFGHGGRWRDVGSTPANYFQLIVAGDFAFCTFFEALSAYMCVL